MPDAAGPGPEALVRVVPSGVRAGSRPEADGPALVASSVTGSSRGGPRS
ncbi:hypothetical protein BJY16_004107 [Actinoplanes octamycinicus]|uniref:Uncharacterized protein n=1 Tax=Actinoplanes octamycinicus TaxID=135948 RepID=A0A7W7GYI1_9ACTN|nr:hypothetical protein [Actinoplanes octamycinicus]